MSEKEITPDFYYSSDVEIGVVDSPPVRPFALPSDPWVIWGFFSFWQDAETLVLLPLSRLVYIRFYGNGRVKNEHDSSS